MVGNGAFLVPPPPLPTMIGGKGKPPPVDGPWDGAEDQEVAEKVRASMKVLEDFWSEEKCADIEAEIDGIALLSRQGQFRPKTVDRTPLRSKYFFGYGYTYGSQISKKGGEQVLPPGMVDEIPEWIRVKMIRPLEEQGLVSEGWVNSAVVNDYRKGGMIVSHIDPKQLFARPIFINTFFSEGRLAFGSRFSFPNKGGPPETTPPKCICAMPRGSLAIMDGFSADGITHGLRPEDMDDRRVSIVLRHVFANAPSFGDVEEPGPAEVPQVQPEQLPNVAIPQTPAPTLQPSLAVGDFAALTQAHLQAQLANPQAQAMLLALAGQMMQVNVPGVAFPTNPAAPLASQSNLLVSLLPQNIGLLAGGTIAAAAATPQLALGTATGGAALPGGAAAASEISETLELTPEQMALKRRLDEERERCRKIDEEVDDFGRRTKQKMTKPDYNAAFNQAECYADDEPKKKGGRAISEKQRAALARLHQRHQRAEARSRSPRR